MTQTSQPGHAGFQLGRLKRSVSGFTLLELMVTVALLAIIATIGVPSWQTLVSRMQVESDVRALTHALALGRSEAVSTGGQISLCPYLDGFDDTTDTACGDDWQAGWIAYRGDTGTIAAGQALWVHNGSESREVAGGPMRITFTALGTSSTNATWNFCSSGARESVVIARSGRVRRGSGDGCS